MVVSGEIVWFLLFWGFVGFFVLFLKVLCMPSAVGKKKNQSELVDTLFYAVKNTP